MALKKIQKWIEAINNYYAFALLVYAAALYIASHSYLFWWIFIATTPLLAAWTGFLLKSALLQRNQRHGFSTLSDAVSYEIGKNRKYTLRYTTTIKAETDHLMAYPIGYRWSGNGEAAIPKVTGKGQQLLGVVKNPRKGGTAKVTPYKATVSTDGDWHYWFIALNPPVHRGTTIKIEYLQEFTDKKQLARPYVRYFVRVPMKRLELNIKFPGDTLPKAVVGSYIKPSDPSRPYLKKGVRYDPNKQWATWIIDQPRKGYCYRIDWQ